MKTITKQIDVYSFDELSEESKEKAINHFRESNQEDPWFVLEANATFEKFANIFGINWYQIDYEEPYRNEYRLTFDDNILELSGLRLAKWIYNNYSSYLFTRKYLKHGELLDNPPKFQHPMQRVKQITSKCPNQGKYSISYYSNIQKSDDCVLTGVCYDIDILKPIYEFLDNPKKNIDIKTLINDCIYSLCHSVSSEIEYRNSDECITEEIKVNEYEFLENGELFI